MSKKYDQYMAKEKESGDGMDWRSADDAPFVLDGLAWREKGGSFRRMPVSSKVQPLPEGVDRMASHSSGVQLRFKTDASQIMVKAKVATLNNAADIMTISRLSFDIYAGSGTAKRFAGAAGMNFDEVRSHELSYCATVFKNPRKLMREFTLNFPLYAEVREFALGVEKGAKFEAPTPWADPRPIVVYGTSIQQGCCATRPGMSHTNLLSRMLARPFVNLGFAGSGRGEPEVARILAQIKNPALYILDYDSNSTIESLERTLQPFIEILRESHPETPVLTVSKMQYGDDCPIDADAPLASAERIARTRIHLDCLAKRRALGDKNIHFLDGMTLFGEDFHECTVDSCHATDLGFYRIAKTMAPEIARILD